MIQPASSKVPAQFLEGLLLALADDELVLGHRDSEWTGFGPILEEDIAFSNIAQDEIGHALVWYTLYQELTNKDPDTMVFRRKWNDFICCRFVEYPKGDFAYTVVRQFLFDVAEEVRLNNMVKSTFEPIASASQRILKEESYHRLHSQSLFERLGNATPESSERMQAALNVGFPQALGIFEALDGESELVSSGVFIGNDRLLNMWLDGIMPVIAEASLNVPAKKNNGVTSLACEPEQGGRKRNHTMHLKSLIDDLQTVINLAPEAKW